jgi:hypothetical protein
MLEILAPGFIYSLAKDGFGTVMRRRRHLSNSEIIALRHRWKPEFEEHIRANYQQKLRHDVIIRDMKRIDTYPEIDESKGISSWFRAGLVGTYHRGIYVALQWDGLKYYNDKLRFTSYKSGEESDLTLLLIGSVPYEYIDSVDWDGDEYYRYPHIYCFFAKKTEPYEHLGYYTETQPLHGIPFFTEQASYAQVRRLSRALRIKR